MITIGILFSNENYHEINRIFRALARQDDQNFKLIIVVEPRENYLNDFCCFINLKNATIFKNEYNKGTVFNRNKIISECKSEYLAFIDGDDFVDKEYVKNINLAIRSNADLYYYNYKLVKGLEKNVIEMFDLNIISKSFEDWKIIGCSVYKIGLFKKIGVFVNNSFEDVELMLRMIDFGFTNFQFVPNTTYYWIKKETGRNSGAKSIDYANLMLMYIKLFKQYNTRQYFVNQYINVLNIYYSNAKYLDCIKVVIRANLYFNILSRFKNKL
jgi:hypothetical protein